MADTLTKQKDPLPSSCVVLAILLVICATGSFISVAVVLPTYIPMYTNYQNGTCIVTGFWNVVGPDHNIPCRQYINMTFQDMGTAFWVLYVNFTYANGTQLSLQNLPFRNLSYRTQCISQNITKQQILDRYNNTDCELYLTSHEIAISYSGYPPFYWLISPAVFGVSLIALLVFVVFYWLRRNGRYQQLVITGSEYQPLSTNDSA